MEPDKTVKELMLKPRSEHDAAALDVIHARRKELCDLFFDKSKPAKERNAVYDEISAIHKYFEMKPIFKVKEARGAATKPTRTNEQKVKDSVEMIKSLWPEAKKLALIEYPKEETGMPTTEGPIVVDKNEKSRSILSQVFLYNMTELYKQ